MFDLDTWDSLGILAIILLILSFYIRKNAIMAIFILGVAVCFATLIISWISGGKINFELIKKMAIISVLAGAFVEIIRRLTRVAKKGA